MAVDFANIIVKCIKKRAISVKSTTSNLWRLLIPQFNLKEEARLLKPKKWEKHEQVVRVENYERNVAALENSRVHVCVVCLFLFCFRKNPTWKVF